MSFELKVSRIVADFVILAICAIPLLIFHEWVTPYKRGFYCDDETIRYPYRPSTVSRQMLIVVGLVIPALLIVGTEAFRTMVWERSCKHEFKDYRCKRYAVPRLVVRLYVFLGYFLVGVVFNQLMVDIAKYTIGRQRPHFMDVCKPKVYSESAPGYTKGFETCPVNSHEYITDFECTGTDKYLVHESMLSFYSGHSAFSFYAAWYTALYLQARLYRPLFSRLLLPVIQFALFGGAAYVAYTRVSNYKHHWSDVLVGALIGSIIGIVVALFVAEVFSRREIPSCDAHYGCDEFGLAPVVRRAPLADIEAAGGGGGGGDGCGYNRSAGGGDGAQVITSHNVTVTGVMAPSLNDIENNRPPPIQPSQLPQNQRFPSVSLQSVSITGSYYSARADLESLISTASYTSSDYYSVLSHPVTVGDSTRTVSGAVSL